MFNNVGAKIKSLAKVVCWVGIIASVIYGIILMMAASNSYSSVEQTTALITGLLIMIIGSVASWILSVVLYGFGQLVEDNQQIRSLLENEHKEKPAPARIVNVKPKNFWTCPSCGKVNPFTSKACINCGSFKGALKS